jgi:GntR family transcriptional regulator
MLQVKVGRSEAVLLHDQVAAEIRPAIAEGETSPADKLQLAKDHPAVLWVNKNSVLRVLHVLRHEGLLGFQRGRGITVAGTPERSALVERAYEPLDYARRLGNRSRDVHQVIETVAESGR